MNTTIAEPTLLDLRAALRDLDPSAPAAQSLRSLVQRGFDRLPLPGSGATLHRWQALAEVAEHDLSLGKLFEGHTDALAIMVELGEEASGCIHTWGTWAAEAPDGRTSIVPDGNGGVVLCGAKCWCSGAAELSHGLLTAWFADGRGPQLVRVEMGQAGVRTDDSTWQAVGMAGSSSIDVAFDGAAAQLVGSVGEYLSRPGFWQGGAGIAACWYGGALALAASVRSAVACSPAATRSAFRLAALGKLDVTLTGTAAVLREAARWIDAHPSADASTVALRARLTAEACAQEVLSEAGRALGAAAFCRDARFARMAADLPVFVRQSHAEKDFAALGERVTGDASEPWTL
jgi:alkylation response protein AidB-like acyl-CoA dehydrogenase